MAHYNSYQDLDIYKLAREVTKDVWDLIVTTLLGVDYKLRDQINGSSGSIMDNIAEGFGRGGNKEFINFRDDFSHALNLKSIFCLLQRIYGK